MTKVPFAVRRRRSCFICICDAVGVIRASSMGRSRVKVGLIGGSPSRTNPFLHSWDITTSNSVHVYICIYVCMQLHRQSASIVLTKVSQGQQHQWWCMMISVIGPLGKNRLFGARTVVRAPLTHTKLHWHGQMATSNGGSGDNICEIVESFKWNTLVSQVKKWGRTKGTDEARLESESPAL